MLVRDNHHSNPEPLQRDSSATIGSFKSQSTTLLDPELIMKGANWNYNFSTAEDLLNLNLIQGLLQCQNKPCISWLREEHVDWSSIYRFKNGDTGRHCGAKNGKLLIWLQWGFNATQGCFSCWWCEYLRKRMRWLARGVYLLTVLFFNFNL
jgi:hypothetical protein